MIDLTVRFCRTLRAVNESSRNIFYIDNSALKCSYNCLSTIAHTQFLQNISDVKFNGSFGDI